MLIDLDAAPPSSRPRLGVLKAVPMVLLLLAIGGAAPSERARIGTAMDTGTRTVTAHLLAADALYTVDATGVQAAPLTAGGPRWRTALTVQRPQLRLEGGGSTLAVWRGEQGGITLLDARTGRERWRTDNFSVAQVLGDRIVYWQFGDGGGDGVLRMADLADGRVRWQREASALALEVDAARRYVLAVDRQGRGTAYSVADGTPVSNGRDLGVDPYAWGIGNALDLSTAEIVGDALYLHSQTFVAAYGMPELTPRWRARILAPQWLNPCGPLICVTGERGASALDPATGQVRWTSPRWRSIGPDGLAVGADSRVAWIDPVTGTVRSELGRGELAGDLLLRFDGERTVVTRLEDGGSLGVLPLGAPGECATAGEWLACLTGAPTVTVWRFTVP
ncbi:PQQ-binding-like beta-propeller repeat protein [Actinoplanes sp. NPDC051513]|uniref:outer membrane protein assembly factor BamB family protein n=1 Tax=Actinoplanes sp. NPDC051513 TaxID=3363908 RepID=UPI0037AF3E14